MKFIRLKEYEKSQSLIHQGISLTSWKSIYQLCWFNMVAIPYSSGNFSNKNFEEMVKNYYTRSQSLIHQGISLTTKDKLQVYLPNVVRSQSLIHQGISLTRIIRKEGLSVSCPVAIPYSSGNFSNH